MSKIWNYLRGLVGNGTAAAVGIFVFIAILSLLFTRCAKAGEVDLRGGTSFGSQGYGPVLGLQLQNQLPGFQSIDWFAGTLLWGKVRFNNGYVQSNWDWHAGVQSCRWQLCAGIGMVYLQRIDTINGSHTNFMLQLSWKPSTEHFRFSSLDIAHISNAGTTDVNVGRQAVLGSLRLQ